MVTLRRVLAVLGLAAFSCMWAYAARFETGWPCFCAVVFAAGDGLGAVAIGRRWFWGRWLGLGIGLIGTANIGVWLALRGVSFEPFFVLQAIAFPGLFLLLLGRAMQRAFDEKASPSNHWRFASWPVRLLRSAVVLNIATAPMLLSYGCIDGVSVAHRTLALATAAVLAVSVVLVVMQRSAGLILMTLAGIATTVLGIGSLPFLLGPCRANDYQFLVAVTAVAAFPLGALGALASTVAFAGPIVRYLRARA